MKKIILLLSLGVLLVQSSCSNNDSSSSKVVKPVASFKSDVTSVVAGGKVAFKDTSTNTPTSWAWTFEGGTPNISTEQNPNITYAVAGEYKVSLIVTNAAGNSELVEILKYIKVTANTVKPVASFTSDVTSITAGGKIAFTDTSTNTPTSWAWTFEGGTPNISTEQNPTNITYVTAGQYKVSLVATNATGSSEPMEVLKYITVIDPNSILPKKLKYTDLSDAINNYTATFTYDGKKITTITYSNSERKVFTYTGNIITQMVKYDKDNGVQLTVNLIYERDKLKSYTETYPEYKNNIEYTYNLDGTISVSNTTTAEGEDDINTHSTFTLDTKGNIVKNELGTGRATTIDYDVKNNPYKNILGYTFLLIASNVFDEQDLPHSINNITKSVVKSSDGIVSSETSFENTYNTYDFLTKSIKKGSGMDKETCEYEY